MSQIPQNPPPMQPVIAQAPDDGSNFLFGVLGGLAGMFIGIGVYYLMSVIIFKWLGLPLLIVGLLVGLPMRLLGRSSSGKIGVVAILMTLLSCAIGLVVADQNFPWDTPSTLEMSFKKLLYLDTLMYTAFSAYLSYCVAVQSRRFVIVQQPAHAAGPAPAAPPQQQGYSAPQPPEVAQGPPVSLPKGAGPLCDNCKFDLKKSIKSRHNHCPQCGMQIPREFRR